MPEPPGALPTGTVTFLFTDIEGSTQLLQHLGDDVYTSVLDQHHSVMRAAIASHRGVEISTEGDAFFVVFPVAGDAVACTLAAQQSLLSASWPDGIEVRVRMGLHSGTGRLGADSYVGIAVHQAARIASAAHGGQVIASTETMQLAGAGELDGVTWRSLGRHRFKDLGAPIEVWQLCHAGLPDELPPLRSLERVAHNIPIQSSSFVGREEDLEVGSQRLLTSRLLTITGPGGVGKTRLAYQLAAERLADFPDGVWVVELASVEDASRVPAALCEAIGVREQPGRSPSEVAVEALATRRALVVLDNCEHVVDAAADLVAALLRRCAGVVVLATTREPMRVAGEAVWALQAFGEPDAVALFCERAAEADAGFRLDAATAPAVETICDRLEGMPLAIELAAARVRTLPLDLIAKRLANALDLLSKGNRGAPGRQASLRATIAWSHDLLEPAKAAVFRRLAVFVGGFTLESAEDVVAADNLAGVDPDDVMDLVDALVDRSLVVRTTTVNGGARYHLLDTIRAFALERLAASAEQGAVADAHATHFAGLIATADDIEVKRTEHPNLLAAVLHTEHSNDEGRLAELLPPLGRFWVVQCHWDLLHMHASSYLARPEADATVAASLELFLGSRAQHLGDHDAARRHFEAVRTKAEALEDVGLLDNVYTHLGLLAELEGDLDAAAAFYERQIDAGRADAAAMASLAMLHIRRGHFRKSEMLTHEVLKLPLDEPLRTYLEGFCTATLATLAAIEGDLDRARALYEASLVLLEALGARINAASIGIDLAGIAAQEGDLDDARSRLEAVHAEALDIGDPQLLAYCVGASADLALLGGDPVEACRLRRTAIDIATRKPEWTGALDLGRFLALAMLASGDATGARAQLEAVRRDSEQRPDPRIVAATNADLANLEIDTGDLERARRNLADALASDAGAYNAGTIVLAAARLAVDAGDLERAAELVAASGRLAFVRLPVNPVDAQRRDAVMAACRAGLDPIVNDAATARGVGLEPHAALASARSVTRV